MNFDIARQNMIEQQIRTWEVLNPQILDLLAIIHREDFIPEEYRQLALADTSIPLAHGQVTMTPKVEARILQSVSIQPTDSVLEIGTGCAYLTALLSQVSKEVTSVDIYPEFIRQAKIKLKQYNSGNVLLENGDGINSWNNNLLYNVIIVTGSLPVLNPVFQNQLTENGRLFIIVGESPVMEATLITRVSQNAWQKEVIFETDLPPLEGAQTNNKFQL